MKNLLILSICLISLNCFANHTNKVTIKEIARLSNNQLNKVIKEYNGKQHRYSTDLNKMYSLETGLSPSSRIKYLNYLVEFYDPKQRLNQDFRLWLVFHSKPRTRAICFVVLIKNR